MKPINGPLWLLVLFIASCNMVWAQQEHIQDSASIYYYKALDPKTGTDLYEALQYYERHQNRMIQSHQVLKAVQDARMLAIVELELGLIPSSEETTVQALKWLDQVPQDSLVKASRQGLYHHLGRVYRELEDPVTALKYDDKALELAQSLSDSLLLWNNKANIFKDLQDYERAEELLIEVYQKLKNSENQKNVWKALDNLSIVQAKLNRPQALNGLQLALDERIKHHDQVGIYASYSHLYEYYLDRQDTIHAKTYANKALEVARALKSTRYEQDALSKWVTLMGNPMYVRYQQLTDSFYEVKQEQKSQFAAMQYDFYKEKERADQIEINRLEEQQKKRIWQLVALFIGIIIVLGYILVRNYFRRKNIKQVYLTESRLSKKMHDEVANDVSDVMNLIEQDTHMPPQEKAMLLDHLQQVYLRTRDISTEIASIDLDHFHKSLRDVLVQHHRAGVKVVVHGMDKINWEAIPDHKKLAIYRSLQELMVNMKKHSQAQLVTIVCKKMGKHQEIWYTDDGVGCDLQQVTRNGLNNAVIRMKEVGGNLTFETSPGNGFKSKLRF